MVKDNKLELMALNLDQVSKISGVDDDQLKKWIKNNNLFQGAEGLSDPRYKFADLYGVYSLQNGETALTKVRLLPKSYVDNGEALLRSYIGEEEARAERVEYDLTIQKLLREGHI